MLSGGLGCEAMTDIPNRRMRVESIEAVAPSEPGAVSFSITLRPETPDEFLDEVEDSLRAALRDCMEREAADATTDNAVARLAEILVALENIEGTR